MGKKGNIQKFLLFSQMISDHDVRYTEIKQTIVI